MGRAVRAMLIGRQQAGNPHVDCTWVNSAPLELLAA
jgi:hypothetical protein